MIGHVQFFSTDFNDGIIYKIKKLTISLEEHTKTFLKT